MGFKDDIELLRDQIAKLSAKHKEDHQLMVDLTEKVIRILGDHRNTDHIVKELDYALPGLVEFIKFHGEQYEKAKIVRFERTQKTVMGVLDGYLNGG